MKIVFVVENITIRGGVEKVTSTLANSFTTQGKTVEVVSLYSSSGNCPFVLDQKVAVRHLGLESLTSLGILYKILAYLFNGFRLLRMPLSVDSIHIFQGAYASLYVPFFVFKIPKDKIICCEHNEFSVVSRFTSLIRTFSYRLANAVVSITEHDFFVLQRKFGKAWHIPNAIEYYGLVTPSKECRRLIFVGRFSDQKDPLAAMTIAENILERYPELKFVLYGYGPLEAELRQRLSFSQFSSRIDIVEDETRPVSIYQAGSLLVMTSVFEGLPMTVLEALSFGVPVVAYDCSVGMRDCVLNNQTGFLIQPGNVEEFLDKTSYLIQNADRYFEFSNHSLRASKKYSLAVIMKQWDQVFLSKD